MRIASFIVGYVFLLVSAFGQQPSKTCDTSYYDIAVDELQIGPGVTRGDLPLTGMIGHADFNAEYCLEKWSNFMTVEFAGERLQQIIFEPGSSIPRLSSYYYTKSGRLAMIVPFRKGKVHGLVYTYHSDGACLTIMKYRRGRFLGYSFYWGQMDKRRLRTINANVDGNPLVSTTNIR
ncbi:MAG: hypothetical protein ACFCUH_13675 [Flavobacteriales bacterium]